MLGKRIRGCPGCDLLVEVGEREADVVDYCPRCGTKVAVGTKQNIVTTIFALSLTGLICFLPAVFSPLLTMDAMGLSDSGTIFDGVVAFYDSDFKIVALVVLLTSVLLPLGKHLLMLVISGTIFLRKSPRWLGYLLRLYRALWEWGMDEVYLIGLFVTLIKVHSMATIHYETGFFAFLGLVFCTVGLSLFYSPEHFWEYCGEFEENPDAGKIKGGTARENGMMICHECDQLFLPHAQGNEGGEDVDVHCPRCFAPSHFRKQNSIARTWALLISAAVLFVPANTLPIMEVTFLGSREGSTIMDGILYFFNHGSIGIGLIILTASVLVPLFKIIGLLLILLSIRFRWNSWLRHKSIMLRLIVFIGRWSMLDIFVIALLCALVDFAALSSVEAAPAATYFTAVVVLTMTAAHTFDSRLLWDSGRR